MKSTLKLPRSATRAPTIIAGTLAFFASLTLFKYSNLFGTDYVGAAIVSFVAVGLTHFLIDALVYRVHMRETTGLDWARFSPSASRTFTKYVGLISTLCFLAFGYSVFPEYQGSFYYPFWDFVTRLLPWWLASAVPYFYFVDSRMKQPNDGYWHMGQLVLLNFEKVDFIKLRQHLLGWLVKGFFLPLMFVYFYKDLEKLQAFDFTSINSFKDFYDFSYDLIFLVDVGVVSVGYLLSLRLFDSHLRSAEPSGLGWAVALICYEPFWSLVGKQYIQYGHSLNWGGWLASYPLMYKIWGSTILILFLIYVWASLAFGVRFSNLTHRGIITSGPYRFTKHPAYVSKNLAWWLISIPFMASGGVFQIVKSCSLLLLLNFVYFMRARTEERHLSNDPTYQEYGMWMNENGLFSKLANTKAFGFLRYNPSKKSDF